MLMTLPRAKGSPMAHAFKRRTVSSDALMAVPAIVIEGERVNLFLKQLLVSDHSSNLQHVAMKCH
jgi:hypothetical protein